MVSKLLMPLLALMSLTACAVTPGESNTKVTHFVMHSPSSTPKKQDCFDITETVRFVTLADAEGNVVKLPQITNRYFPTACTPDARPYEPLSDSLLYEEDHQ